MDTDSTRSVSAGTGFSKFHGITGLSRIPWNPAGFSQREKSRGKSCFFSDVAPSKTKIRFPGWFHVYFFFNCFSDILKIAFSVRIARPITKIVLLCLPSDNVSYMFHSDMNRILQYCNSLSPLVPQWSLQFWTHRFHSARAKQFSGKRKNMYWTPVSYTHLTLPTNREV